MSSIGTFQRLFRDSVFISSFRDSALVSTSDKAPGFHGHDDITVLVESRIMRRSCYFRYLWASETKRRTSQRSVRRPLSESSRISATLFPAYKPNDHSHNYQRDYDYDYVPEGRR